MLRSGQGGRTPPPYGQPDRKISVFFFDGFPKPFTQKNPTPPVKEHCAEFISTIKRPCCMNYQIYIISNAIHHMKI